MARNIMKKNGKGGNIVHIVSSSAFEPEINKMPYSIAKAGQVQLIRSMAVALAPDNIIINGVSPTYVFTNRHNRDLQKLAVTQKISLESLKEKKTRKQLIKNALMPDDLTKMIEFAATTQIMTGKIIHATLGRIR